jgi:hypothetical protein
MFDVLFRDKDNLRVFELLKSDSKYQAIFENRIKRLELWKSKIKKGNTAKKFKLCSRLSAKCQKIAESLEQSRINLLKTFPTSTEKAIDGVIAWHMKIMRDDKELQKNYKTDIGKLAKQQQEEEYKLAKKIVLEAITQKWAKDEETLADFIDKRVSTDNDLTSASTKMTAGILYDSVLIYSNLLSVCMSVSEMAEIYRGLFYVGIINIDGGKIDKEIIFSHAKEIGGEAFSAIVGNIPGVSLFLSGAKIVKEVVSAIQEFRDVDVVPDVVESVNFVEEYLAKYENALFEWKKIAEPTVVVLNNLAKSSNQYAAG